MGYHPASSVTSSGRVVAGEVATSHGTSTWDLHYMGDRAAVAAMDW